MLFRKPKIMGLTEFTKNHLAREACIQHEVPA